LILEDSESSPAVVLALVLRGRERPALREAAAELVAGRGRTHLGGPAPLTPEQERLRDSQRTLRQFAQGGVYAGGSSA
jgi:hypothetical protein